MRSHKRPGGGFAVEKPLFMGQFASVRREDFGGIDGLQEGGGGGLGAAVMRRDEHVGFEVGGRLEQRGFGRGLDVSGEQDGAAGIVELENQAAVVGIHIAIFGWPEDIERGVGTEGDVVAPGEQVGRLAGFGERF